MSLKCCECGNIFDECEAGVHYEYHDEVPGGGRERFYYCPCCGSDEIEETVRCRGCKGEFLEKELFAGYYCEECIECEITYDSFLEFATMGVKDSDEIDTLEDFVFIELFYVDTPNHSSAELKEYCKELYKRKVANEKLLGKNELMEKIHDYFFRVAGLKDDFAEYFYGKEVGV